jgi:hypothetical protein
MLIAILSLNSGVFFARHPQHKWHALPEHLRSFISGAHEDIENPYCRYIGKPYPYDPEVVPYQPLTH